LVAAAPFIESEADLTEGLQYLAGCIAGCTHLAFDYDRDHPFMQSGTGPFTKMGLDNPDTLYFGTRVQPGHEYVVTGTRGTTTDLIPIAAGTVAARGRTDVERLLDLGATIVNEITAGTARWTTFADPDGNELDLIAG